ncbi:MAG: Ca-activated chloride channel [Acidobacteriota bacterium]|jgi:Ca-activated chloride channel family protein|nr:Ca-activated chloride channel [Acidobacteriota bacterium]
MDEVPPPPPQPRPTPTPAEDTNAGDDIGVEDVVRITSNLVTVPASVVDSQGKAVVNLALEDFELRVDGQPKQISELSRAEVPVTLALLFDNSQSLTAAREFEKQAAIRFFRSVIRPIDRAAIYSVSTDVVLAQPLTNNVSALVRTIEHFNKPEGATRLLDAIAEAASYLRPYPGRKVIIIVSDGEDTLSDMDFDAVLRKTLAADCQVYAVQTKQIEYVMLTGQTSNANLQALAAERRMQDLTAHTGGTVYTPLQTSDLDSAFTQISADLAQQYILSYYPTDERPDGRFRTISVRISTRPNMRVRARRGYYPRRAGERFSYNNETPAVNMPVADAGKFVSQETSSQADNTSSLASNIIQPEKPGDAPSRSRRIGPSETSDVPTAGSNVRVAIAERSITEQPVVRREERTTKPAESAASPPPKPVADTKPVASNDRPPASGPVSSAAGQASSPPPPASKPITGGVLNGKAVYLPKPLYPPSAKNMRASGVVTVEVLLSEEGKVISARAVDGNPFLRPAALAAARQARFTPTALSGKPVQVTGVITYTFTLAP